MAPALGSHYETNNQLARQTQLACRSHALAWLGAIHHGAVMLDLDLQFGIGFLHYSLYGVKSPHSPLDGTGALPRRKKWRGRKKWKARPAPARRSVSTTLS